MVKKVFNSNRLFTTFFVPHRNGNLGNLGTYVAEPVLKIKNIFIRFRVSIADKINAMHKFLIT
jgi:hypothetical protein